MSSSLNKFLKSLVVYGIGTILPKLIGIILLPIYTHVIRPDSFGYYDMSTVAIALITSIVYFNIWTSTLRFMYRKELDKYQVVRASIGIFGGSSLFILAGAYIVSLFVSVEHLIPIVIYGIVISIAQLAGFISRGNGDTKGFVYGGALNSLITGLAGVTLLLIFDLGILALYIGAITGGLSQLIFTFSRKQLFRKVLSARAGLPLSKQLLIYSLPLAISTAGMWFIQSYGRFIVGQESLELNGLYSVAFRLAAIVSLVTTIFNFVWQDTLFDKEHASEEERDEFYSKGGNIYIKLLACGTAVVLPALYLVAPLLVSEEYRAGIIYIPLLVLAGTVGSYGAYLGSVFYALLKTNVIFYSTLIPGIIAIFLVPLLVGIWGPNGASIAALVCIILSVGMRQIMLRSSTAFKPSSLVQLPLLLWLMIVFMLFYTGSTMINIMSLAISIGLSLFIFRDKVRFLVEAMNHKVMR